MITKTKIDKKTARKNNSHLIETILNCKKSEGWLEVAHYLSTPKRKKVILNLSEISEKIKDSKSKTFVIPGKVLSQGDLKEKVKIVAFNFSSSAKEKLKENGVEFEYIENEIKSNPDAKNMEILK